VRKAMVFFGVLGLLAGGCSGGEGDSDGGQEPSCIDDNRYVVPIGPDEDTTFWVGPYLEHTTTTAVAVGWESLEPADTRLEIGPDEGYGQVIEGDEGTMHQVIADDLEPGTTYHYRACSADACTRDLTLATDPGPSRPIRFSVYADCQDNPDIHHLVAEQVIADEADLAVVVGDTVSDGNLREQYKERYYDPARRLSHYVPRWAAVGNHDRKDPEVQAFIDYHIFPEDPDVPQAETSYSFTYGDAFFLVYDNTLDHYDFFFPLAEGVESPLWEWLKAQASSEAAQKATWRFAFGHYPPHSTCRLDDYVYGMPESAVAEYVLPMLQANGFQAHFAGHVHCYERLDFDGFLAITTGGGGGGLESEDICDDALPESRFHECVHHEVTVELGCETARLWARDIDGQVIDELILHPDGSYEPVE